MVIIQVVMTANILYEAVEPQIVWKQLLNAILNELTGDGSQNEVRITLFKAVPITHFLVDVGSPIGSLHSEVNTCSGRRDPDRSFTNCILSPLRSLAGWLPLLGYQR